MRILASVTAALVGGSLALALPGSASSATLCPDPLGTAGAYTEFVEGDAVRAADSDGAVAIGGDADFTGGFRLGSRLSSTETLTGGATLVVGGTLRNGTAGSEAFTVLERGAAVYGARSGRPAVLKSGGDVTRGTVPIDFAAEFDGLREFSDMLSTRPARGTVTRATSGGDSRLTLAGNDTRLNIFPVDAGRLASADHIIFQIPPGSTALVNVSGTSYDTNGTGARDISGPKGLAAKLLWNFPDATEIVNHNGTSWPGTLLAPAADVKLGQGGTLRGSVIAKSLTATGTKTRHAPFTGCLSAGKPSQAQAPVATSDLADTGGTDQIRALLAGSIGALAAGAGLSYAAWRRARRL